MDDHTSIPYKMVYVAFQICDLEALQELKTITDSYSLFEGLWDEWLNLNVFLLAREMQLDDVLYEDLFNNLPKEK